MIVTAVDRAVGRKLARIEPVMEGKERELASGGWSLQCQILYESQGE